MISVRSCLRIRSAVSVEEVVAHFQAKTRGESEALFKVKESLARRSETMKDG
jgi:hypothetical protein